MTLAIFNTLKEHHSSPSLVGMVERLCVLVCIVLFGAACSDGYSENSEHVLTPAEMTQAQRLQQMNQIGKKSNLDTRWRYKMTELCELKVTTGNVFARKSTVISLKRGQVVNSVDKADKTHDVHLKNTNAMVPLLEATTWVDSVSFYTLIRHLQQDCILGGRSKRAF